MAIDTEHPDYRLYAEKWKRCRDAMAGEDAVKAAKETYLPRVSRAQKQNEYDDYLARAMYVNMSGRTKDGFHGMAFRKDPDVVLPDLVSDRRNDITPDGKSDEGLAREVLRNVLVVGRHGLFVDFPNANTDGEELSQSDVEAFGIRPYISGYRAEDIVDWHHRRIGGQIRLSMVKLRERSIEIDESYERTTIQKIRVLELTPEGEYRVRLYSLATSDDGHIKQEWQLEAEWFPRMSGERLRFIPFVFADPVEGGADVHDPILLDLVNVNLSHFRTSADLEHGAHFTGLPTPWFVGFQDKELGDKIRIGSAGGIVSSNPDAKVGMLEFSGNGLSTLENGAKRKEEIMALLGARMLMSEPRKVEAAETAEIHRTGEDSILGSLVANVSEALERAFRILALWSGVPEEALEAEPIVYQINRDFMPHKLSPQMLQALMATWQQGGIAFGDFIHQLKLGEVVRPDRDPDDIRQDQLDEPPPAGTPVGSGGGVFE